MQHPAIQHGNGMSVEDTRAGGGSLSRPLAIWRWSREVVECNKLRDGLRFSRLGPSDKWATICFLTQMFGMGHDSVASLQRYLYLYRSACLHLILIHSVSFQSPTIIMLGVVNWLSSIQMRPTQGTVNKLRIISMSYYYLVIMTARLIWISVNTLISAHFVCQLG